MNRPATKVIVSLLLASLFLLPYLPLFFHFSFTPIDEAVLREFTQVWGMSFFQALLSAVLSCVWGILGAYGLLALRHRLRRSYHTLILPLVLLPQLLPVLFLILASLRLFSPFPYGVTGIVLLHVLLNGNLLAVLFSQAFLDRAHSWSRLAEVEGAGRFLFLRKALIPGLRADIWSLGSFVFLICFTSFSIPLVVGKAREITLEVFIFETLRIDQNLERAILYAFSHFCIVLVFSLLVGRLRRSEALRGEALRGEALRGEALHGEALRGEASIRTLGLEGISPLLRAKRFIWLPFIPLVVMGVHLFPPVSQGLESLRSIPNVGDLLLQQLLQSFILATSVGLFTAGLLLALSYFHPPRWFDALFSSLLSMSQVVLGLALLLWTRDQASPSFVLLACGLTLIFTPALYCLRWRQNLADVHAHRQMADILGATPWLNFRKVIFPLLLPRALWPDRR
jgi:thiamine transport system permease protein